MEILLQLSKGATAFFKETPAPKKGPSTNKKTKLHGRKKSTESSPLKKVALKGYDEARLARIAVEAAAATATGTSAIQACHRRSPSIANWDREQYSNFLKTTSPGMLVARSPTPTGVGINASNGSSLLERERHFLSPLRRSTKAVEDLSSFLEGYEIEFPNFICAKGDCDDKDLKQRGRHRRLTTIDEEEGEEKCIVGTSTNCEVENENETIELDDNK